MPEKLPVLEADDMLPEAALVVDDVEPPIIVLADPLVAEPEPAAVDELGPLPALNVEEPCGVLEEPLPVADCVAD